MRSLSGILLGCTALLLCPAASAVSCGDVLTSSVVLTEDLVCSVSPALTVARSGVVVDLNGHSLATPGWALRDGIVMRDVAGVTIKGPGRLHGFRHGVHALRADHLSVSGVEFSDESEVPPRDSGVALSRSRFANIQNNRFKFRSTSFAIYVTQPNDVPGGGAGQHKILNNEFDTDVHGVFLCGADAGANRIENNRFLRTAVSVWAMYQADGNVVQNNTFEAGAHLGVWLETNKNLVGDNAFKENDTGIFLFASSPVTSAGNCLTRPRATEVFDNWLVRNGFYGTSTGIELGVTLYEPGSVIRNNFIQKNWFDRSEIGIDFAPNTRFNYATPNTYTGVPTPVVDDGVGNVY